jgi:hypothetical protein
MNVAREGLEPLGDVHGHLLNALMQRAVNVLVFVPKDVHRKGGSFYALARGRNRSDRRRRGGPPSIRERARHPSSMVAAVRRYAESSRARPCLARAVQTCSTPRCSERPHPFLIP